MLGGQDNNHDQVGPVLQAGAVADAIVRAILQLNDGVAVLDRGAYHRVSVRRRCVLTRVAVEEHLGRPLRFPGDLEKVMPSFMGTFTVSEERAEWTCKPSGLSNKAK